MSERYSHHAIITIDESDFAIYRRKKREIIPILFVQKQSKSIRRSQPNCIKFPSLMLGLRSQPCATSCLFMLPQLQLAENVYTYTGNLLYGQLALAVQK
jgi:hypothetical protein